MRKIGKCILTTVGLGVTDAGPGELDPVLVDAPAEPEAPVALGALVVAPGVAARRHLRGGASPDRGARPLRLREAPAPLGSAHEDVPGKDKVISSVSIVRLLCHQAWSAAADHIN